MTDKPNSYVLGTGRLYFEPVRRYPADALTLRNYQMSGKLAEGFYEKWLDANFILRVISITGYNPQMLLPAPSFEREFRQSMAEWAAEQIKLPYATVAAHYMADRIDFERNSDVLLMSDTMYDAVQTALREAGIETNVQMVTYMHAAFIHESDIGDRKPVGKIELFDYDDHAVIVLEGSGELPGVIDESFYLKARYPARYGGPKTMIVPIDKPTKQNGRSNAYLDHDPTKRHKRRKKK